MNTPTCAVDTTEEKEELVKVAETDSGRVRSAGIGEVWMMEEILELLMESGTYEDEVETVVAEGSKEMRDKEA